MKHTKKYLAVLMAISILLCSIIAVTSFAANSSQCESEAEIDELQPVMATGCIPSAFIGEPNSQTEIYGKQGELVRIRYFGPDGLAIRDKDIRPDAGHPCPHYHDFSWVNGEYKRGEWYVQD